MQLVIIFLHVPNGFDAVVGTATGTGTGMETGTGAGTGTGSVAVGTDDFVSLAVLNKMLGELVPLLITTPALPSACMAFFT